MTCPDCHSRPTGRCMGKWYCALCEKTLTREEPVRLTDVRRDNGRSWRVGGVSKQSQRNQRDREQRSIYHDLPRHARKVQTARFGAWIRLGGGKCLNVTNPYEVARWKSLDRMSPCIIYRKADGTLTWTVNAADDYRAFLRECGA